MPRVKAQPNKSAAPKVKIKTVSPPITQESREERKLSYPEVEFFHCTGVNPKKPYSKDPLTYSTVKKLLGWETEEEYITRKCEEAEARGTTEKVNKEQFQWGDEFLLRDMEGKKVNCWNNSINRPFDLPTALSYAQDILTRNWAGARGTPPDPVYGPDTINGEDILIGRTGLILSAQHRLIGFMLAVQAWRGMTGNKSIKMRGASKWKTYWPTEPVFPTGLKRGISEAPEVVRTLDNVRPRSLTDVIATSGIFDRVEADNGGTRSTTRLERVLFSKMLSSATDFLWYRTRAGEDGDFKNFQTHAASGSLISNHTKLLDCIKWVYEQNKGKTISALSLQGGKSAGVASTLMYMMAACESSGDNYRNKSSVEERNESDLDFSKWDKARDFWALVANDTSSLGTAIRKVSRPRVSDNADGNPNYDDWSGAIFVEEDGGSSTERIGVICKAWNLYKDLPDGEEIDEDALKLEYHFTFDDEGKVESHEVTGVEDLSVSGIDCGERPKEARATGDLDEELGDGASSGKGAEDDDSDPFATEDNEEEKDEDTSEIDEDDDGEDLTPDPDSPLSEVTIPDTIPSADNGGRTMKKKGKNTADPTPDEIAAMKESKRKVQPLDESPEAEKARRLQLEQQSLKGAEVEQTKVEAPKKAKPIERKR